MKKLVIAEKPSVARDLARVLGKIPRKEDYFENEEWVIDSAVGHLVELYMPDDFDPKLKSWKISNLPIIPPSFELKPISANKKKFQQLKKQLKRKDIEFVINACDAGREGELIFTYIYELSKSKLPAKRLWMLSMTDNSIKEAFLNLRNEEELRPLQDAARCRSESDWLIGINGTRAVTIKRTASRGRQVSTVGRVQTPTLSLVIDREHEIRDFVSRSFYKISAEFSLEEGNYTGIFQKEGFSKNNKNNHDRVDRIWYQEEANSILADIESHDLASVTENQKRSPQSSGKLYDLTSLQREANRLHSLSASRTLQIAQSLYEKHKAITYPRTDSKALPEDYGETCREIIPLLPHEYKVHSDKIISENWVDVKNKKIFDNKKISDHFAIIPTNNIPKSLDEYERRVYNLIVKRFLAVFYPPAQWDITTRLSKLGNHTFKTEGKVLVEPSWLSIYGKDQVSAENLVPLVEQDENTAKRIDSSIESDETKPPPRYTEATLLSAMEGAGKLVEDEELAEALKEKGLGTPATRASTIEHLIKEKYLRRETNQLHPTIKGEDLFDFLKAAGTEVLTSPSLTGEWEYKLRKIEDGTMSREEFMLEISKLTEDFVDRTTGFQETADNLKQTQLESPINGSPLYEGLNYFQDLNGDFKISKSIAGRRLEQHEVHSLLKEKRIGPLDDFVAKTGRKFSAMLKLEEDFKVTFVFDKPDQEESNEKELIVDSPDVAECPVCNSTVKQTELSYICTSHKKVSDSNCNFRISRKLLDKEIPLDEFQKLVNEKKTGLIRGFVSRRTKRPFDANLILKDNGSIGFEFPPRPPKKKKKTA